MLSFHPFVSTFRKINDATQTVNIKDSYNPSFVSKIEIRLSDRLFNCFSMHEENKALELKKQIEPTKNVS